LSNIYDLVICSLLSALYSLLSTLNSLLSGLYPVLSALYYLISSHNLSSSGQMADMSMFDDMLATFGEKMRAEGEVPILVRQPTKTILTPY
jgi:hypothetical protein